MGNWLIGIQKSYNTFCEIHDKHVQNNRKILKSIISYPFRKPFYNTRTSFNEAEKVYKKTGNVYEAFKRYSHVNDSIATSNRAKLAQKLGELRQPTYETIKQMNNK